MEVSKLLAAAANKNRLKILRMLREEEISVGDIKDRLNILSQSALSQHLAVLRNTNMVKTRRASQTIYYSLNNHWAITDLLDWADHAEVAES